VSDKATHNPSSQPDSNHQQTLREAFDNLHTPVAVTKGYVQTLRKHWEKLNDEQRRTYVDKALDATGRIASALSDSEAALRPLIRAAAHTVDGHHRRLEERLMALRGARAARVRGRIQDRPRVDLLIVPERAHEQGQVVDEVVRAAAEAAVEVAREDVRVVTVPPGPHGDVRRKLVGLTTQRTDNRFVARVWLERHGDVLAGEAGCDHQPGAQYKAAAWAVLNATNSLLEGDTEVLDVDLLRIGSVGTATVAIRWNDRKLIGTAEVQKDQYDAIARATLDAINRFISPRRGDPSPPT
jgi:hypothetical protein